MTVEFLTSLLKKYIKHVGYNEGVSFLENLHLYSDGFTLEEVKILQRLDNEIILDNLALGEN